VGTSLSVEREILKRNNEIETSDIYTSFKMLETEGLKKKEKPKRWWQPTVIKEKVVNGAEVIKKFFIGIKVRF
jgi:hypothetical protein